MNIIMKLFYLTTIVLCLFQHQVEGIQCHQCNSKTDVGCEGKDLEKFKVNCSTLEAPQNHTYFMCRKVYQELEFQIDGKPIDIRVIRECGYYDDPKYNKMCYHTVGLGAKQEICSCTEDFCNSSSKSSGTVYLIASVSAFFYLKLV